MKVPTPIELLSQFLSISREIPIEPGAYEEEPKFNQKDNALKILSLKIATHLRWNLDLIEKHLTFRRQVQLISFLCNVTGVTTITLPGSLVKELKASEEGCQDAMRFAMTISYLWIIRMPVAKFDRSKSSQMLM